MAGRHGGAPLRSGPGILPARFRRRVGGIPVSGQSSRNCAQLPSGSASASATAYANGTWSDPNPGRTPIT
jgi:hypothetical protein